MTLSGKLEEHGYEPEELSIAVDFKGKEEFPEACIGVTASGPNGNARVVYDVEKVIDVLMKRDGMEYEDAREYVYFNIIGVGGDDLPIFLETNFNPSEHIAPDKKEKKEKWWKSSWLHSGFLP